MKMNKLVAIIIIFFFIGVAVAPSINSSVVKTSDDLVEVTSQACGIQGFGNTTVKLTKQQYQDLEQYLVDFRAKLNQTTSREEAVPIFKDAVVELNKYGLLPKGMNVEKAQNLVLGMYQNPRFLRFLDKMQNSSSKNFNDYANYLCLISGRTSNTVSRGVIFEGLVLISFLIEYISLLHSYYPFGMIFTMFYILTALGFGLIISTLNPIQILSTIGLGVYFNTLYWSGVDINPAVGWIRSIGLNGVKNWSGGMYGDVFTNSYFSLGDVWMVFLLTGLFYSGILGFSGIKIILPDLTSFYVGFALKIKISTSPPPWIPFPY
jgi:hypothetical protein